MEFVSGGGENKIVVSWLRKNTRYNIEISKLEVYLDRLSLSPMPLTPENLEKVKQELARWEDVTRELCTCLDLAITEIEKEPPSVKSNAELSVECGSSSLHFIAGQGKSHIHILFSNGLPRYRVRVSCVDVYLDRLSCRAVPLTTDNLLKLWKETEGMKGCTVDLRACLKRALQEFNALSPRHRANTTIFIDCDGKSFKMVSGQGQSWISVVNIIGDQHCHRDVVLALEESGPSSAVTGSSSAKRGKEGPSLRVRKLEGRRGAEEGPSNLARRSANRSKGLSNGKRCKKGLSSGLGIQEGPSSSWKMEEETSFAARTFSGEKRTSIQLSNCSRALEREHSLRSKAPASSGKRKLASGRNGKEKEPEGPLNSSNGTTAEEGLIHGTSEELGKEMVASDGSSEEEGPSNALEKSSDSRLADDGPNK